jgi:hypothetical protein
VRKTLFQYSSVASWIGAKTSGLCVSKSGGSPEKTPSITPALLMAPERPPNRDAAASTAASPVAASPMSPWTNKLWPPLSRISLSVASPSSFSQSTPTTFAPSRARRLAAAAPMPRAEPVTMKVFPAKRPDMNASGFGGAMSTTAFPVVVAWADAVAVVALAAAAEAAIMPAPLSISRLSIGYSPWGEHHADRARLAPVRSNVVVGFPQ